MRLQKICEKDRTNAEPFALLNYKLKRNIEGGFLYLNYVCRYLTFIE